MLILGEEKEQRVVMMVMMVMVMMVMVGLRRGGHGQNGKGRASEDHFL